MRKTKGSDYQQMLHTISSQSESNLWGSKLYGSSYLSGRITLGGTKSIGGYDPIVVFCIKA